ncbi:MAG TPA: tetratricopeptide repeat protein, partial [Pseudobdellovibrionaceae bacterium]|nr:tetratricopeptide repeat protein [Pseudobdellovibrionaceae bacterium]
MFRKLVSISLVFTTNFGFAVEKNPAKQENLACQKTLGSSHNYDAWEMNESEDPVTYRLRVLELMNKYLKDKQSRRAYNLGSLYVKKFPQPDLALDKSLLAAAYASNFLGEAQNFALKIHEVDPTYLNAIGILAKLAIKRKDFKTALMYAKKQLKLRPESLYALGFAADACIGLEDFEGALKYAKEQYRLAPDSEFGPTYMARAYIGLNQLPEARKLLHQILDKSPLNLVASGVLMRVDLD